MEKKAEAAATTGDAEKKGRKPTAVTGLQIVEFLALNPRGARLGEIAQAVEMDTAQTHRMVNAMLSDGWLMPVGNDGSYALTARAIRLGSIYISRLDLSEHARLVLDGLARTTRESVFLGELRKEAVVCVGRRVADHSLRVWTEMGDFWTLDKSAMGHAIIAARHQRLSQVTRMEPATSEIADAIRDGYARDYGRYRDGVQAVAAAVRDASGIEIGAVALSVPAARVDDDRIKELGRLVCQGAKDISERLGYTTIPLPEPQVARIG
jgi:DNA-binding IclR family transcriptional regulator